MRPLLAPFRLGRVPALTAGVVLMGLAAWALPALADERTDTLALLDGLRKDVAHQKVLADPVAQADAALERGTRLRALGDEVHAHQADGLAREWAETGRDLVRAVDAEDRAADLRSKAMESQAKLARTRALIEEAVAQVGRLRAQIDEANKAGPRTAVEVHESDARPAKRTPANPSPSHAPASATDGAP